MYRNFDTESDWSSASVDGDDEMSGCSERRTNCGNEKALGCEVLLVEFKADDRAATGGRLV